MCACFGISFGRSNCHSRTICQIHVRRNSRDLSSLYANCVCDAHMTAITSEPLQPSPLAESLSNFSVAHLTIQCVCFFLCSFLSALFCRELHLSAYGAVKSEPVSVYFHCIRRGARQQRQLLCVCTCASPQPPSHSKCAKLA